MKILELRSENFKRLKALEIRPDGSLVTIAGRNGAGKTSVLDSIYAALAGKAAAPAVPIRKGAEQATIRLALGDDDVELIVTRTFRTTKDGTITTSLTVESPDGATFRSPQTMLDRLIGELSFDPLAFSRAKPAEQIDMLKRLVPGIDFDQIERQNEADYQQRRDINRRARKLRAQAAGIEPVEDLTPIDETELVAKLEQAGEHNAEIERRRARREKVASDIKTLDMQAARRREQAAQLRRQAETLDAEALEAEQAAAELQEKLANAEPLPAPIDTSEIRAEIERAREINRKIERAEQRKRLDAEAARLEQQAEALTRAMEERNEQKAAAIEAANLPVPGLAFGDGAVTLNGVPFEQASDAEKLRASVAIAATLAGKLKVIRIRDGSLLDDDGMRILADFGEQHGMQIWLEKVDSSGRVGFVIENGELVAPTEEAAA